MFVRGTKGEWNLLHQNCVSLPEKRLAVLQITDANAPLHSDNGQRTCAVVHGKGRPVVTATRASRVQRPAELQVVDIYAIPCDMKLSLPAKSCSVSVNVQKSSDHQ